MLKKNSLTWHYFTLWRTECKLHWIWMKVGIARTIFWTPGLWKRAPYKTSFNIIKLVYFGLTLSQFYATTNNSENVKWIWILVSHVSLPQVSNIQARAVVLSWAPPVGLSCGPHSGLSFPYSYEVALSDKGRDGKYKIIYRLCMFLLFFFAAKL